MHVNYISIKNVLFINLDILCTSSWSEPHPQLIFPGGWHLGYWVQRLPNKGVALIMQRWNKGQGMWFWLVTSTKWWLVNCWIKYLRRVKRKLYQWLLFLIPLPPSPLSHPNYRLQRMLCGKVNTSAKALKEGTEHFLWCSISLLIYSVQIKYLIS